MCTTAGTILPTLDDGTPLFELKSYAHAPHAYMKIWKHHGTIVIAGQMKQLAAKRNEESFSSCSFQYLRHGSILIACIGFCAKLFDFREPVRKPSLDSRIAERLAAALGHKFHFFILVKKLCDGLEMTLGEFFSARVFDELEQEIL